MAKEIKKNDKLVIELLEKGVSPSTILQAVFNEQKLTNMVFDGIDAVDENALSFDMVVARDTVQLAKVLRNKVSADLDERSELISEFFANADKRVGSFKFKGKTLATSLIETIANEKSAVVKDSKKQDTAFGKMFEKQVPLAVYSALDLARVDDVEDYFVGKYGEEQEVYRTDAFKNLQNPIQKFICQTLAYGETVDPDGKKYHPLAPLFATCIVARNMAKDSQDVAVTRTVENIEAYISSYVCAAIEHGKAGKVCMVKDIVLGAEKLADKILTLSGVKQEGDLPASAYLHDIALYRKLFEVTASPTHISSGIDKGSKYPLCYIKPNGFPEIMFSAREGLALVEAEEGKELNNLTLLASDSTNEKYTAEHNFQEKAKSFTFGKGLDATNKYRFANMVFAVYGQYYAYYAGLPAEELDHHKVSFADVFGETTSKRTDKPKYKKELAAIIRQVKKDIVADFKSLSDEDKEKFSRIIEDKLVEQVEEFEKEDTQGFILVDETAKPAAIEDIRAVFGRQNLRAEANPEFAEIARRKEEELKIKAEIEKEYRKELQELEVQKPAEEELVEKSEEEKRKETYEAKLAEIEEINKRYEKYLRQKQKGTTETQTEEKPAEEVPAETPAEDVPGSTQFVRDDETIVSKPEEGETLVAFGAKKAKPTIKAEEDIALSYRNGLKTPKKDIPGCWFTFVDTVSEIATQMAHPDDENSPETKAHTSTLAAVLTDRDLKKRRAMIFDMLKTGELDKEKYASTYEKFKKDCPPAVAVLEEVLAKALETQHTLVQGKPIPAITVDENDEKFKEQKGARNKAIKALEKEAVELAQRDGQELAERAVAGEFGLITAKKKTTARKKAQEVVEKPETGSTQGSSEGGAEAQ